MPARQLGTAARSGSRFSHCAGTAGQVIVATIVWHLAQLLRGPTRQPLFMQPNFVHRGTMQVLDRHSLEQAYCECYAVVKEHFDAIVLPPESQDGNSKRGND
jgi:hypothetical protein